MSCPFLDEPVAFFGAIREYFGERVVGEGFLRVESVWKFAEGLEIFESDKRFSGTDG